jgi:ABC-2 type transport system ATP-binding protein
MMERPPQDRDKMTEAIKVENLLKRFEDVTAVDHISFSVSQGELFGLLGPNGAGKTTTINILSTLIKPTSGTAEVAGHDVARNRDLVRKSIGIVFQEPALDGKLTGRENLEFHAMMYRMNKVDRGERIRTVLDLVELQDKASVLVEKYSGGMKRRLEIARGLIHRPKVLFLDEPTLGLDAQTRRHIWEYVRKLNKESEVTIILTTHYMEEADFLCGRIAIMDHGKFVALDTAPRLKDVLGGDVVSLEIESGMDPFLAEVRGLDWIKQVHVHDDVLHLTMDRGERRIPELITLAQDKGAVVSCVHLRKPSLEDVFLHFTGRTIRDAEVGAAERSRLMMNPHGRR